MKIFNKNILQWVKSFLSLDLCQALHRISCSITEKSGKFRFINPIDKIQGTLMAIAEEIWKY